MYSLDLDFINIKKIRITIDHMPGTRAKFRLFIEMIRPCTAWKQVRNVL